jgi:hypothetical protein
MSILRQKFIFSRDTIELMSNDDDDDDDDINLRPRDLPKGIRTC